MMSRTDNPFNRSNVIILEDDDSSIELSYVEQGLRRLKHACQTGQSVSLACIDLTRDEETQRNVHDYEKDIIGELDGLGRSRSSHCRQPAPSRNPPTQLRAEIPSFRHNTMLLKTGTVVEVSPRPQNEYCWQFLRIIRLYVDFRSRNIILQGVRLTRTRHLRGMLPRMKNEVCALYDINRQNPRPENAQGLVETTVGEVVRTRAVSKTNDAFPTHRFNPAQWDWNMDAIENSGNLVQRWKFCRYWPTSTAMETKRSYSGALIRLRSTDIEDEHFRVADDQLRNIFRGGIIRGGSWTGGQVHLPIVNSEAPQDKNKRVTLGYNQKYTADDMFCGAGGASRGIQRAGLQLGFACDFDEVACNTYHENFPRASLKRMNIFEFAKSVTSMVRSDLMHISPPCQVWSPAHTRPGQNDEANVATLFACAEVLENRRPRLSTGEQTFGLLFDRNEEFFNALIGQYTALGYSFRWDILRFKEYSVPSIRRRLIWIASCPGEPLPSFPTPTHSDTNRDLPDPVTIRSVLGSIAPGSQHYDHLHNVQDMLNKARHSSRFPMPSYDDRCQAGTITTSGSEWPHPSGRRDFTMRELSRIQGFPQEHTFVGGATQIRRQIGNAFPPVVVETLYRHLRNCLHREDNVVTPESARQQDIIILDPVDDIVVSSDSKFREFVIIDDSDDERPRGRRGSVYRNRIEDVSRDKCADMTLADLIDQSANHRPFSRESSRTLSAESLPSLIEMEVGNKYNGERMDM